MSDDYIGVGHDRSYMSSPVATIDWSSSTRGTYRKLQGADLLYMHGPQGKLSAKNSLELASIEVVEEFKPWTSGFGVAPTKYLISMYDDWRYTQALDDYQDLYYGGFSGDASAEGTITLGALGASMAINEYSMYLKRATIVPISLPRTTRPDDFESDAAKLAGFLDPNDYFRYTCNFEYYGENDGWNDYSHESSSEYNMISWTHIGTIDQTSAESSTAGSWNTLRETFYGQGQADSQSIPGHYGARKSEPTLAYASEGMRYALTWSKSLIKIQETSMLHASAHLSDTPDFGAGKMKPSQEELTQGGMNLKPHMSWQDDQHYAGYTDNHCGAIGAYLYEYCGPLYDNNCLVMETSYATGNLSNLQYEFGMPGALHIQATARQPYIEPWEIHADNEHETTAQFQSPSGDVTKALEIRFDSDTISLSRANAYIDYYTGYLYEMVEQEAIPREYKTKMQATPGLDRNLVSVVRGVKASAGSTPSTFTTSTAGSTPTMGSSY